MKYSNLTGETMSICPKCGTMNFFDTTDSETFSKGHCYHCETLIEIPEPIEWSPVRSSHVYVTTRNQFVSVKEESA